MALITFEPGATHRMAYPSAWSNTDHNRRSTKVQREGGQIEEIHPGDVVWFAPGEKHWHGAAATAAMSPIAIQEKLNDSPVNWME
jgi:hypothetical protein